VYVIGEPVDAGHLARAVLAGDVPQAPTDVASVSVPRGTLETVRLPVGTGDDWDFYWTQASPRPRPGESHAVDLDLADRSVRAELDDLVRISSPRASARPGDDRVRRWMGIRDPRDGQLVACAAHAEHVPGVPVLKTIATHPGRRGEGLGRDITAAITRRAFAGGAEVVTLGMYADNLPARRAYERLGFTLGAEFSSRELLSSS
jgi:ribosomal protein S18 acetylase RimI-like enzyme